MIRTVSAAFGRLFFVRLFSVALFAIFIAECTFPSSEASESDELKPRQAMFVGLDVSGSFKRDYDDAVAFLAHYLYGHLKGLGGLEKPRDLFVGRLGERARTTRRLFTRSTTLTGRTSHRSRRACGSGSRQRTRTATLTPSSTKSRASQRNGTCSLPPSRSSS